MASFAIDIRTTGVDEAVTGMGRVRSSMSNVASESTAASSSLGLLSGSLSTLSSAASVAVTALAGMTLGKLMEDTALLRARYDTLAVAMQVVGNNAGYSGAQMEAGAKSLQKLGIAMMESRDLMIKMTAARMDLSKAEQLADLARNTAVIGGLNTSQALQSIVRGIQSGEQEILKTIGINVQWEAGYKKLAETMGKTSNDLTEQEKLLSRTNTVLAESSKSAGVYEAAMTTTGKVITSLTRFVDNLKLSIGEAFQPALRVLVDELTSSLEGTGEWFVANKSTIIDWGKNLGTIVAEVVDWVKRFGTEIGNLAVNMYGSFQKMTNEVVQNREVISVWGTTIGQFTISVIKFFADHTDAIVKLIAAYTALRGILMLAAAATAIMSTLTAIGGAISAITGLISLATSVTGMWVIGIAALASPVGWAALGVGISYGIIKLVDYIAGTKEAISQTDKLNAAIGAGKSGPVINGLATMNSHSTQLNDQTALINKAKAEMAEQAKIDAAKKQQAIDAENAKAEAVKKEMEKNAAAVAKLEENTYNNRIAALKQFESSALAAMKEQHETGKMSTEDYYRNINNAAKMAFAEEMQLLAERKAKIEESLKSTTDVSAQLKIKEELLKLDKQRNDLESAYYIKSGENRTKQYQDMEKEKKQIDDILAVTKELNDKIADKSKIYTEQSKMSSEMITQTKELDKLEFEILKNIKDPAKYDALVKQHEAKVTYLGLLKQENDIEIEIANRKKTISALEEAIRVAKITGNTVDQERLDKLIEQNAYEEKIKKLNDDIASAKKSANPDAVAMLESTKETVKYHYEWRDLNADTKKTSDDILGIKNAQIYATKNENRELGTQLGKTQQIVQTLSQAKSLQDALNFSKTEFSPGQVSQSFVLSQANIPSHDVGSAYVPNDMLSQIHKGEIIIDPTSASILRNYGISVNTNSGGGYGNAGVSTEMWDAAWVTVAKAASVAGQAWRNVANNSGVAAQVALDADIQRRTLQANGDDAALEILTLKISHENELAKAREDGLSIDGLMTVQALEMANTMANLAVATAKANKALEDDFLSTLDSQAKNNSDFYNQTQEVITKAFDTIKSQANDLLSNLTDYYSGISDKFASISENLKSAATNIYNAMNDYKSGEMSTLSPGEQYSFAKNQFTTTATQAMSTGDPELYAKLPELQKAFLSASLAYNAKSGKYTSDFNDSQSVMATAGRTAELTATQIVDPIVTQANEQTKLLESIKTAIEGGFDTTALLAQLNAGDKLLNDSLINATTAIGNVATNVSNGNSYLGNVWATAATTNGNISNVNESVRDVSYAVGQTTNTLTGFGGTIATNINSVNDATYDVVSAVGQTTTALVGTGSVKTATDQLAGTTPSANSLYGLYTLINGKNWNTSVNVSVTGTGTTTTTTGGGTNGGTTTTVTQPVTPVVTAPVVTQPVTNTGKSYRLNSINSSTTLAGAYDYSWMDTTTGASFTTQNASNNAYSQGQTISLSPDTIRLLGKTISTNPATGAEVATYYWSNQMKSMSSNVNAMAIGQDMAMPTGAVKLLGVAETIINGVQKMAYTWSNGTTEYLDKTNTLVNQRYIGMTQNQYSEAELSKASEIYRSSGNVFLTGVNQLVEGISGNPAVGFGTSTGSSVSGASMFQFDQSASNLSFKQNGDVLEVYTAAGVKISSIKLTTAGGNATFAGGGAQAITYDATKGMTIGGQGVNVNSMGALGAESGIRASQISTLYNQQSVAVQTELNKSIVSLTKYLADNLGNSNSVNQFETLVNTATASVNFVSRMNQSIIDMAENAKINMANYVIDGDVKYNAYATQQDITGNNQTIKGGIDTSDTVLIGENSYNSTIDKNVENIKLYNTKPLTYKQNNNFLEIYEGTKLITRIEIDMYTTVVRQLNTTTGKAFYGGVYMNGNQILMGGEPILNTTTAGFASGGYHSGGLRLVGERGPELEVTGPSRIFNFDQTRQLLSGGADRETVAELRKTNKSLAASIAVLQAGFNQLIILAEGQADNLDEINSTNKREALK